MVLSPIEFTVEVPPGRLPQVSLQDLSWPFREGTTAQTLYVGESLSITIGLYSIVAAFTSM